MSAQLKNAGSLEAQIRRFEQSYRKRLRRIAGLSPRLADLVFSFPACAFALVSDYGTSSERAEAIRLVKAGASLKAVAEALGLAYWTRKLPPETFIQPLGKLPDGPEFSRRVAGLVPEDAANVGIWLSAVCLAAEACDEEFAVWVAGKKAFAASGGYLGSEALFPLAAYAWFSSSGGSVAARAMVERPWQKNFAFGSAAQLARDWIDRIASEAVPTLKRRGPGRYSLRNGSGGYAMVALMSRAELFDEGRVMDHCAASYAGLVESGQCLIFSVRSGQQRIATLEIRRMRGGRREFGIVQLMGPQNRPVARPVAEAVQSWMVRHAQNPLVGARRGGAIQPVDPKRWNAIWDPYLEAKPALRTRDVATYQGLMQQAGALAQLQQVVRG